MKKLNKQLKGSINVKVLPLVKTPSFVLSVPDDSFVVPDRIQPTVVHDSKKLLGG